MAQTDPSQDAIVAQLLEAALPHVAFDGWSEVTIRAAAQDTGLEMTAVRAALPRGAVDLALAYHAAGDAAMLEALDAADLDPLRFRERVALAVRLRIEAITSKEAVRRGSSLFALPLYAADGAGAVWGTADKIWTALGDSSDDLNWYTKRASLSAVYGSTVLYWLGDDSVDAQATWAFLDRRIENVMAFEKLKARVNDNPVFSRMMAGPNWLASRVKAPRRGQPPADMPGHWSSPQDV